MKTKLLTIYQKLLLILFSTQLVSSVSAQSPGVLVGYWKMDEGSGSTLIDNSGNGNDAVLQNPKDVSWEIGKDGLAIVLPSTTNRFAKAPSNATLNIADYITIAAWIKPEEKKNCTILSKSGNDGYELSANKNGKIEFTINADTYGTTYRVFSNTSYPINGSAWMHVAATFNGTTSKIYINGIEDVSVTFPTPVGILTNTSDLYIGSLLGDKRWKGSLDEVRLYHGVLNSAEIGSLAFITPPATPSLIAPANGATNIVYDQVLSWDAVANATKYSVEVSTDASFQTAFLSQNDITATSYQLASLTPNTLYYWRIRAANSGGYGPWSSAWSFTTAPLALPAAPTLTSPGNASTNISFNTTLSWTSVSGAVNYKLEVSPGSDFSTLLADEIINSTSFQLNALSPSTVYYWRVRALNGAGSGPWSAIWNFTTMQQPSLYGFASLTPIAPLNIAGHTADKPQAKTWKYANKWWTVLSTPGGTKVFRLDGTTWTDILTISTSNSTKADCRVDGNLAHVLLYRSSNPSYLYSLEYDPATNKYKLWSQRTSRVDISFESGTETAVMTVDGNGRMWVANAGTTTVVVRWADAPYSSFSAPITIASGIDDDDICAITNMPGKIGVLWSNQNTRRFGFITHIDGTSPTTWTPDEVPASQSALDVKNGMADDHIAMISASDGTVYCAVKTGYDTNNYPQVALLVRRPSGVWDDLRPVAIYPTGGSRPIVTLNEALGKIKIIYTTTGSTRDIVYKEALTSDLIFGNQKVIFGGDGHTYDYSTVTHQTYDSDLVILATDETSSQKIAVSVLANDIPSQPGLISNAKIELLQLDNGASSLISNVTAFPNPVHDKVNLSFSTSVKGKVDISVIDIVGKVYMNSTYTISKGNIVVDLARFNLKPGIYMLRINGDNYKKTIKLTKD